MIPSSNMIMGSLPYRKYLKLLIIICVALLISGTYYFTSLWSGDVKSSGEKFKKSYMKKVTSAFSLRKQRSGKENLTKVFKKTDVNHDRKISRKELEYYIHTQIRTHIDEGVRQNVFIFTAIDTSPRNGIVSWDEYKGDFLVRHGLSKDEKDLNKLSRTVHENLMRDKAAWSEAARSDPDSLNLDEFLAFRHPESSHAKILEKVQDMFDTLDLDANDLISEKEFVDGDASEAESNLSADELKVKRRKEFREVIDGNHNGEVDRAELLIWTDPRNPHLALKEAALLMEVADENRDGALTLEEIFDKADIFLSSKMVDTAGSFHDEF